MGEIMEKGLAERQAWAKTTLGNLAYNRLALTRQIEDIDTDIAALEAQLREDERVAADAKTDAAIEEAKAAEPEVSEAKGTKKK